MKLMNIRKSIVTVGAVLMTVAVSAQMKLPTKTINGKKYYSYEVKKKETIYSIAQKLGVTKDEIVRYNPSVAEGFEKKQVLFFPVDVFGDGTHASYLNTPQGSDRKVALDQSETVVHKVLSGETLYGVSKLYNVSQEAILAANPGCDGSLRVGQELVIPQPNNSVGDNGDAKAQVIYHTVKPGETLYSLAKKYNTNIERIVADNPGVSPQRLVAGASVKIEPNTSQPVAIDAEVAQMYTHKAQKDETFASIAKKYGITEQQLKAANPQLSKVKNGKIVYVPVVSSEKLYYDQQKASIKDLEKNYSGRLDAMYDKAASFKKNGKTINIGVVLPFQLHKDNPPRQALLYTEFYKGFLLGVNEARTKTNKKINVLVYDTQHNLNRTDSILELDALKNMDFIVAPSEPQQLKRMNDFGKKNGVYVLNCFTVKNEDYINNPRVMQVNIPSTYMAGKVTEWFDQRFSGYSVIFLDDPECKDNDIFNDLKAHIEAKKYKTNTLTIIHELTAANLSKYMNPGTKYVFVPTSGNKNLLKKIVKALRQTKKDRVDCDFALFGYPEYSLYLRDFQDDMQAIDTYIYARFFNSRGFRYREVEKQYENWYGEEMLYTAPTMGLCGYDTANYLIGKMASSSRMEADRERYDGVQTDFKFQRVSNWGGFINNTVNIIHFTPNKEIIDTTR